MPMSHRAARSCSRLSWVRSRPATTTAIIKLFAAHFVKFAHPVMSFIHFFTYCFVIVAFESIAHIKYTLLFTDYIFSAFVIFFGYFILYAIEHLHICIAKKFYSHSLGSSFARFTALVVD